MQDQSAHVIWQNICEKYLEKEVPELTYVTCSSQLNDAI